VPAALPLWVHWLQLHVLLRVWLLLELYLRLRLLQGIRGLLLRLWLLLLRRWILRCVICLHRDTRSSGICYCISRWHCRWHSGICCICCYSSQLCGSYSSCILSNTFACNLQELIAALKRCDAHHSTLTSAAAAASPPATPTTPAAPAPTPLA
jgi:hypothetical protein